MPTKTAQELTRRSSHRLINGNDKKMIDAKYKGMRMRNAVCPDGMLRFDGRGLTQDKTWAWSGTREQFETLCQRTDQDMSGFRLVRLNEEKASSAETPEA